MMNAYRAYRALACLDKDCQDYVAAYAGTKSETTIIRAEAESTEQAREKLFDIIVKGQSYAETEALLSSREAMDIINSILVPALDEVGKQFEAGRMFLPQLMQSA